MTFDIDSDTESEPNVTATASPLASDRVLRPSSSTFQAQTEAGDGSDTTMVERLVSLSFRLRRRGLDLESTTGLSGRELDLVSLLCEHGPMSVKSLVIDLKLPRSTMTALVDRLEERGLVIRQRNPEDRRSIILEATPSAHDALVRYREGMIPLVELVETSLPKSDCDELARLIDQLATTL